MLEKFEDSLQSWHEEQIPGAVWKNVGHPTGKNQNYEHQNQDKETEQK